MASSNKLLEILYSKYHDTVYINEGYSFKNQSNGINRQSYIANLQLFSQDIPFSAPTNLYPDYTFNNDPINLCRNTTKYICSNYPYIALYKNVWTTPLPGGVNCFWYVDATISDPTTNILANAIPWNLDPNLGYNQTLQVSPIVANTISPFDLEYPWIFDGDAGYIKILGSNQYPTNPTFTFWRYEGYIGLEGYSGATGSSNIGFEGFQGAYGMKGHTGNTGLSGNIGLLGKNGLSGEIGIIGSQGLESVKINGNIGKTGPTGAQGIAGYKGLDGSTGSTIIGPQGYRGNNGAIGLSGSQGNTGFVTNNSARGSQGENGVSGITGVQGYLGSTGYTNKGNIGSSGYSGFDGSKGLTGFDGKSGWPGFSGLSGSSGNTGFTTYGPTGAQGFEGFRPMGGKGSQGFIGDDGFVRIGVEGLPGSKGINGQSVFSGIYALSTDSSTGSKFFSVVRDDFSTAPLSDIGSWTKDSVTQVTFRFNNAIFTKTNVPLFNGTFIYFTTAGNLYKLYPFPSAIRAPSAAPTSYFDYDSTTNKWRLIQNIDGSTAPSTTASDLTNGGCFAGTLNAATWFFCLNIFNYNK